MAKKLISFDDTASGTGLPSVVEQRLRDNLGGGDVGVALEGESGYSARPDVPLVIWRGSLDPREYPDFLTGVDLWAQTAPWTPPQVTWFTDFSTDTVGGMPAGWSVEWAPDRVVAEIVDDGGTNVFRIGREAVVFSTITLFQWNDIPPAEDVEMVVRWRGLVNDPALQYFPAALRASGTVEEPYAYGAAILDPTNRALRLYNGSRDATPLGATSPTTYAANQWRWLRFRIEGTSISTRHWIDGDTEPTVWDTSITNTTLTGPGAVGMISTYLNRQMEISHVGVGIDGASAPVSA